MTDIGKTVRLTRIFDRGKTVMVPVDDSLISGPESGLRALRSTVRAIVEGGVNAVLSFKGGHRVFFEELGGAASIVNLTASTTRHSHTRKVLICSVSEAAALGADAVAVHVNVSSRYESEMLKILGDVSRECGLLGIPLMALMYPRTEAHDEDDNYLDLKAAKPEEYTTLVRHAVRIGVELGADIVKTYYTGSVESFASVVEAACGVPLVIAGGPKAPLSDVLAMAYGSMQAGGSGVCFGRNTFMRDDSAGFVRLMRSIVHDNATPDQVLNGV